MLNIQSRPTTSLLRVPRFRPADDIEDVEIVSTASAREATDPHYAGFAAHAAYGEDFESLSAPKKNTGAQKVNLTANAEKQRGSTLEHLLVVQYPNTPEEEKNWESFQRCFYAGNNAQFKAKGVTRDNYLDVCEHLAREATYTNAAISLLRWITKNAGRLSASSDAAAAIYVEWQLYTANTTAQSISEEALKFINACSVGNSHIIRPVKGAYVVMFTGTPGFGCAAGQQNDGPLPETTDSLYYKEMTAPGGALSSKVGKAAVAAAKYLVESLMERPDSTTIKGAMSRQYSSDSLRTSAAATIKYAFMQFAKATGIAMPLEELSNIPNIPENLLKGVGTYMTKVVMKEANESLVRRKHAAGDNASDESLNFPVESGILSTVISYTFALTIPEEIARYISQAQKDERVSLFALNTWVSVWASIMLAQRRQKGLKVDRKAIMNLPRYVLPASKTLELTKRRKEIGYYTEPGKVNTEGIFISNSGTLNFLPPSAEMILDNAIAFEKLTEEALALSFAAGTPLNASTMRTDPVFDVNNKGFASKISDIKGRLDRYKGSMQSYSWDYNVILTTSATQPDRIVAHPLNGATKPNPLFIADYMRKPFAKSMSLMFPHARDGGERASAESFGHRLATASGMLGTSVFRNIFSLYEYLVAEERIPDFPRLLAEAAKELKITDLSENGYEKGIYGSIISDSLTPLIEFDDQHPHFMGVEKMLEAALLDAEGGPKSNLLKQVTKRNQADGTQDTVSDDERYFSATDRSLAEFTNVFKYLGGKVFQILLQYLTKIDKKHYMVVNQTSVWQLPSFSDIVTEVMPFAVMFASYAPRREEVYAMADKVAESNAANDTFTAKDIKLPGSREGFQLFPHQVEGLSRLSSWPAFAILDVSPGGGKTTSLLTDIGMHLQAGKSKRFLIMCPTRLSKNWIEDMHKHTEGKWNFIPITTAVYKKWGEDRLAEMIDKAPPNTIVVVGFDWLSKTRTSQIVLGRHVERISTTVELIKRFGFDYIGIDESHRTKKMHPRPSQIHRMIKSITTASSTKYLRLATGTLINNVLMDIVGQTALYTAAIFRTPAEFDAANKELGIGLGGRKSLVYMSTAAKAARDHLNKYATVISTRRREWAFMLPIPKESFMFVPLVTIDEQGRTENEADDAHRLMYEALFKSTLEEIKGNPEIMALLTGRSEDDGDDDGGDESDDDKIAGALADVGNDQDDDTLEELSMALTPYLQRLEASITDPLGDRDAFGNEFGSVFFKGINQDNYVSAKVRKVIERIKDHYNTQKWQPGRQWKKGELVDSKGSQFSFEGKAGYVSTKPPQEDNNNWKPQAYGKVLIFCRYIRSVEAIYRALPPSLKSVARRFHSQLPSGWADLEEFKSSAIANPQDILDGKAKGVQILIAGEQAISEGHNLQMASRMIRVEMPWAPGELDQSSARIFRPDPSGKNARDFIYLDWIVGSGTMEVAKLGCLISKILTKAQFDEAENDFRVTDDQGNEFGYGDINRANLPTIKMSLKNIENIRWREDLIEKDSGIDYLTEYGKFVQLQGADFLNMRKTRTARMIDIEPTPMVKGAAKMEFQPYVPNQKVVGHKDWGLVLLNEFLQDDANPEAIPYINDKKLLKGKYVHTEFGNGVIVSTRTVNATGKKSESEDSGDPKTDLSSVKVQLAGTNEIITLDADVVHLAPKLSAQQAKLFAPKELWIRTEDDKKRVKANADEDDEEDLKKRKKVRAEVTREIKEIAIAKRRTGKLAPVKRAPIIDEFEDDEDETPIVELYPVVYNGYLAMEGKALTEQKASVLEKFAFRPFGDYLYAKVNTAQNFEAIFNYLDKRFFLADGIYNKLVEVETSSFATGRGRKFDIDLAPIADFKNFYIQTHRKSAAVGKNGKPEVKVYPMVIGGDLFLVIDLDTNPAAKKLAGATITGATTKFGIADGMYIAFFKNKASLKEKVLEIKNSGIEIDGYKQFIADFNALKVGTVKPPVEDVGRTARKPAKAKSPITVKKTAPAAKKPVVKAPAVKARKAAAPVKAPAKKAVPATKTAAKKKPVGRR